MRVPPFRVMGKGFAVEKTPPGRGERGFSNRRAGLPRVQGKRGDFSSMLGRVGSCGGEKVRGGWAPQCEGDLSGVGIHLWSVRSQQLERLVGST